MQNSACTKLQKIGLDLPLTLRHNTYILTFNLNLDLPLKFRLASYISVTLNEFFALAAND